MMTLAGDLLRDARTDQPIGELAERQDPIVIEIVFQPASTDSDTVTDVHRLAAERARDPMDDLMHATWEDAEWR